TERQRLELHPEFDWPYRVTGTQLGIAAYRDKYRGQTIERRTNLDGDAIADPRFKAFFEAYGGLAVFGYPISALLIEPGATDGKITVQYFERARFELAPNAAPDAALLAQVRLAALGREYIGIAADCASSANTATTVPASAPPPRAIA